MAPHGIGLSRRRDGRWQLLVVNHRGRESIELLELVPADGGFEALWHGCVANTGGGLFNDVAATPEGGFIATVMLEQSLRARPDALATIQSGVDTGYLMEWTAGQGLVKLPGSEAPFNNGVLLAADGKSVFFNAWTVRQVRQYDRALQKVVAVVKLPFHPDNLTVRADGQLVAAGIDELDSWRRCAQAHSAFCLTAFGVAAIDPATRRVTPLHHADAGVLAGASVALQVDRTLYIGTYMGDRLLKVQLPAPGDQGTTGRP